MELGEVLRDRRKAAGRTIASVAVDAGLSVPYIANLENGRGNPTVAALDRLATALGAQLEVRIGDSEPPAPLSVGGELVSGSDRADSVVALLADAAGGAGGAARAGGVGGAGGAAGAGAAVRGRSRVAVRRDLVAALDSLAALLGRRPSAADLSRFLDLLQLSQSGRGL
ncbi:transcriptional regulator with XRE-family HTH domain [Kribbella rubisoli]|uniref:Transcriptional regulator with XRE-family HTH domain n=1 Tax=Kribbella rubisoli TaxID=3075929 RepID=A0A4Q7WT52_9ACTN|nr:helix-turn-helix transcriptional regulator [Kribbella rubisoli]RZU13577.1 transcriptional regulator with XRE-family HTH domain [Kribbella rubisoli]